MIIGCGRRVETVVPFAVPGVAGEPGLLQFPHLPVRDLHALGVSALVEPGLDFQAGSGGGRPDGVDDDLVTGQFELAGAFARSMSRLWACWAVQASWGWR
jgi:hypothetical protein